MFLLKPFQLFFRLWCPHKWAAGEPVYVKIHPHAYAHAWLRDWHCMRCAKTIRRPRHESYPWQEVSL